jgi:transcriptional regulator GlxA family with amidase domain
MSLPREDDLMPHVAMVLTPGFQFLALGAQAAFELANVTLGEAYYSLGLYSPEGGMVSSSSGFSCRPSRWSRQGRSIRCC